MCELERVWDAALDGPVDSLRANGGIEPRVVRPIAVVELIPEIRDGEVRVVEEPRFNPLYMFIVETGTFVSTSW